MVIAMAGACAMPVCAKKVKTFYSCFSLECKNEIYTLKAKASTSGAEKPYYNNVVFTVYNKKGNCIGSANKFVLGHDTAGIISKAEVTINKTGIKTSKSCHSVLNPNYSHVLSFNQQIVVTEKK